jgi:Fe-S-cluster containining protein
MPEPEEICQSCGACCAFYVRDIGTKRRSVVLFDAEAEKIPHLVHRLELPIFTYNYKMKRVGEPHEATCIALAGELGKNVACTIYEQRPAGCRTFTVGGKCCNEARVSIGLERI